MKFIEGMIIGGMVATGITLMYANNAYTSTPQKMIKKGKQFVKKMGLI